MNRDEEKAYVMSKGVFEPVEDQSRGHGWCYYKMDNVIMWAINGGWQVARLVDGRYVDHAVNTTYREGKARIPLTIDEAIAKVVEYHSKE